MGYSKIQVNRDTVIKSSDPGKMHIEIEKTLRAHEIGKNCGLFYVPKVIDYDKESGVAILERINKTNSFDNLLYNKDKGRMLIKQTGRALAVVHRDLTLPDDMIIELPDEFRYPGTEVFIHGDFNSSNVCLRNDLPVIVILDWQTTHHHGGEATWGSRYFDLVWFINYMLWTIKPGNIFRCPINSIAKHFLESYFEEIEITYDVDSLIQYFSNFFEKKLQTRDQHASWQRCFMSNKMTKWFMNSLHSLKPDPAY